jgi:hypothetical protein
MPFFYLLSMQFYPTLDTSNKSFHDPEAFSFSNATIIDTELQHHIPYKLTHGRMARYRQARGNAARGI